ncbi:MAG: RNA polymerase subunit sigma [Thermodesulfobacterium geofontis]|uniref:protein acetyllysine N-acetyltransferase n=1 Tax=Thermodesulfobacterium geofontis TaxID=1295609 RepID=A0A2N7Q9G8_9BACT|nr:MAG: RNA polymerase subunit sigma [Thermodesulfobacterium geofontis]PMP94888.1 MAG: RNA polymerase subunit sigma [Thermodesulfobacterium geofontis]
MDLYRKVAELIKSFKYLVAFTGAGISVESGIPPFRGSQGLWSKYDPEEFAHIESFLKNPAKVWKMIRDMFTTVLEAKPNTAHKVLAEMEKRGYLKAVITQNIDGLHQEAGSKNVIEFHGNCKWLLCLGCGKKEEVRKELIEKLPYPKCPKCEIPLKPDVVFFGESIPFSVRKKAETEVSSCDFMLVIGTSGVVYPAAELPYIAKIRGAKIVEINLEETPYTFSITDYFLKGKASKILSEIFTKLS